MTKYFLKLSLASLMILAGCQSDPVKEDLTRYVQQDLFALETNLRAAHSQYVSAQSKPELTQVNIIKTKVILQLEKYLRGLQAIEPKTGVVLGLNDKGIERVKTVIEKIDTYRKTLIKRDSNQIPIVRSQVEAAYNAIDEWKDEITMLAREKGVSVPQSRIESVAEH